MQPLEHLPQAFGLGCKLGDVLLKLGVPLTQIGVLPYEVFQVDRVHRAALQPMRANILGSNSAATTSSADAMKSDGISSPRIRPQRRRRSPSIEIGGFGSLVSAD